VDLERLQSSFAQVFGELLPALISALVVLFAGYLLAKVVERPGDRRA
jgi:L-lactate permease